MSANTSSKVASKAWILDFPSDTLTRGLSPSEQEVVERLFQGWDNSLIAEDLKKTKKNVEAIFNRLFRRLGCNNRVVLALRLRQHWPAPAGEAPHVTLTKTEEIIVKCVSAGLTNKEIAAYYRWHGADGTGRNLNTKAKLKTKERDIQNRLVKIYDKLLVKNRIELALWDVRRRNLSESVIRTILDILYGARYLA